MAEGVTDRPCTWQDVPGYFDFGDLYSEMVSRAPPSGARFVEIGVLFGKSTLFLADAIRRSGKQIVFDAIDRYGYGPASWYAEFERLVAKMPLERAKLALQAIVTRDEIADVPRFFVRRANLEGYVNLVSADARIRAGDYEDASLDFVFVDNDHSYKTTKEIIQAYLSKVRPGGVIAGHDFTYMWPGVMKAVNEVFGRNRRVRGSCWIHTKVG